MLYRKLVKNGPDISLLGYGCMRFPTKNGLVNKDLAMSQMKLAFDSGVNYYDTAYIYHNGKSEVILGDFVRKYGIRDKVYIADKLPSFFINKTEHLEKYFSSQLQRLQTDYIDFYLMHTLGSLSDWELLKSVGVIDFIAEKKAKGQIKYVGFSFHGKSEEFIKILEDYAWDFCQIQFNYLDEHNQAGLAGLRRAHELGLGVVVMEPLRGGSLAVKAPDKVKEMFANYKEKQSAAYWGLKFVMNHKEVSVVLSGMNDISHVQANCALASTAEIDSMTTEDLGLIEEVKKIYAKLMKVPCTGCGYCMPCPVGVDIPGAFSDYNSLSFFGKASKISRLQYLSKCAGCLGDKAGANLCINCKKCMRHCPQNIEIPTKLKEAHKALDNVFLRYFFIFAAKFIKKK